MPTVQHPYIGYENLLTIVPPPFNNFIVPFEGTVNYSGALSLLAAIPNGRDHRISVDNLNQLFWMV